MSLKRYSRQRELIYQAVRDSREHPTAEMIYQQLKPAHPNLSRGTVYRNLNFLTGEGALVRMPFSVERFDAETAPHTHFRCRSCDRIFDMDVDYDRAADALAASAAPRFQIERHELIFQGLCSLCREREAPPENGTGG